MTVGTAVVTLDGIPGAGKSRLLRELEGRFGEVTNRRVICLQEPVEEWSRIKDAAGNTLFSLYYGNQKRYALAFQLQVLHTRFVLMEKTIKENPDALIITERDLVTDYKIFTQMLYDKGMFEELEFKLYLQLFDSYQHRLTELLSGLSSVYKRVYLTTSAGVAHKRMKSRGRPEEKDVPLEYLETVEQYHKNAFCGANNLIEVCGDDDWDTLPDDKFRTIAGFVLSL